MEKNAQKLKNNILHAELDLLYGASIHADNSKHRLSSSLFLAALIHGIIILGINFSPTKNNFFNDAIAIDVTIVVDPDPNSDQPEIAKFLAQTNQKGTKNTINNTNPKSRKAGLVPIDNNGITQGYSSKNSKNLEISENQSINSKTKTKFNIKNVSHNETSPEVQVAAYLKSGAEKNIALPEDYLTVTEVNGNKKRELITSVDTQESIIANYLYHWKTRIETIGIRYFPKEFKISEKTGSPVLEVIIDANGNLNNVVVTASSGSSSLDEIAISILRQAAPFDPFPRSILTKYDQLRFAYKWEFGHLETKRIPSS